MRNNIILINPKTSVELENKKNIQLTNYIGNSSFEETYLKLRQKEGRIYSNKLVKELPVVPNDHTYLDEWNKRTESSERFIKYIQTKKSHLNILEVGCGNGWFSNRIALTNNNKVIASDVNMLELTQGSQTFADNPNLTFVYADLSNIKELNIKFDLIVFAASIQYFQLLPELMVLSKDILISNGEIHILDSPFYSKNKLKDANERSRQYYEKIGFPEMARFYFHHRFDELLKLGFKINYSPKHITSIFKRNRNPFYWFCYKHSNE